MDGVLLLNKPLGMSSNQAVQKVRWLCNVKKVGHTGTLDPLASGLLVLCLGQATKYSQYLLAADKTYETIATLGVRTTTGDCEGEIVSERTVPNFSVPEIESVLSNFRGPQQQTPSMYSALKYQGKPLYYYARQGQTVPRVARDIMIHTLSLDKHTPNTLDLTVQCSKGTYIRTLVEDIGESLRVGAHVSYLHRTQVGKFSEKNMVSFDDIAACADKTQLLMPITALIEHFPRLDLSDDERIALQQGKRILPETALPQEMPIALYTEAQGFIGLGQVREGSLKGMRLLATNHKDG